MDTRLEIIKSLSNDSTYESVYKEILREEDQLINGFFDAILLYGTINNMFNPQAMLKKVYNALKYRGRLIWAGIGVAADDIAKRIILRSCDEFINVDPGLRRPVIRRYTIEDQIKMAFDSKFNYRTFLPFIVSGDKGFSKLEETNSMPERIFSNFLIRNISETGDLLSPAIGFFSILTK